VTVPSSDAGGLPLDLDQIEAAFDPDKPLADLEQRARHREDHSSYICVNRADVFAVVAWVRALEAEVQQLQEQNARLEAWRATPRAFDWKGTF
jgi:hypothetical protein